MVALTIFSLWNPRRAFLGAFLFGGIEVAQFFVQAKGVSPQLLKMLPYLGTLLALIVGVFFGRRLHIAPPAALGEPYNRNQR